MKRFINSRRAKILSGIGTDTLGSILATIVGFAVIPFYFDYITVEQFGIWLTVSGLVALITMADISSDQYLITVVADDSIFDSPEICNFITATFLVKLLMAVIFILVGTVLYLSLSSIITNDSEHLQAEAKSAFLMALILLVVTLLLSTIPSIMTGRHHFSMVNSLTAFSSIVASIGALLLLKMGQGILSLPLALLIANLAQNAVLFVKLKSIYPHLRFRVCGFQFPNKKKMFSYSLSFILLRWVHTLRSQYIVIAINNLIGPGAVTVYHMTVRLPLAVAAYGSKAVSPLFPSFAEYFAKNNADRVREIFLKITKLLIRFSLHMGVTIYFVGNSFVTLWVGEDKFAGQEVQLLLILNMIVIVGMSAFGIVIFASKKFENWNLWSVVELFVSIGLSYSLSIYGLKGIVAGFVVGSYFTVVYLFRIVLRQLELPISFFLKKISLYCLVPNVVTLLAGMVIITQYPLQSWFDLILICGLLAVSQVASWEGIKLLLSKESGFKAKLKDVIQL